MIYLNIGSNLPLDGGSRETNILKAINCLKKLNLNLGDYVSILSSKSYETFLGNFPRSANFKIIGFFEVGMYEYDTSLVFMPMKMLQEFVNQSNKIDHYEVVVQLKNLFLLFL